MIELKYKAHGKVKKISSLHNYPTQALLRGALCLESIQYNEVEDQSNVTLRFLVDDAIFNDARLNGVNAKNLLPLSTNLPDKLVEIIMIWVNKRGDKVVAFTPTINKTELSVQETRKLSAELCGILSIVIGDAARALPFMNGLNIGIKNAGKVAQLIVRHFDDIQTHNRNGIQLFLAEYAKLSEEALAEGLARVYQADRKITRGQMMVGTLFYASLPIKLSMRSYLKRAHPIFEAYAMLDLSELIKYVQGLFSKDPTGERYLISHNLLTKLQSGQADKFQIQALISLAFEKNRDLETYLKKNSFLGIPLYHC
ncbi:MAG: hypothetical protein ABI597_11255 [Gammaproteobacteria bacterium]